MVGFAAPATDAPKKYQFGVGANPAPRIEDQYLTDAAGKEFRAVSVLKASSSMRRVSVELPMTTQIRDGMTCSFSDPVFGLSGNFWVDRVEMNIEAIKMTYKLDLLAMSQSLKSMLSGTQKPVIGRVNAYLGNGRFRVSYQGKQAIVLGTAGIVVGQQGAIERHPERHHYFRNDDVDGRRHGNGAVR